MRIAQSERDLVPAMRPRCLWIVQLRQRGVGALRYTMSVISSSALVTGSLQA